MVGGWKLKAVGGCGGTMPGPGAAQRDQVEGGGSGPVLRLEPSRSVAARDNACFDRRTVSLGFFPLT